MQPFVSEDDTVPLTGQSRINLLQVIAGTERVYSLAEYKIKTAFGSDLLFFSKLTNRQGLMLTHLTPMVRQRGHFKDGNIHERRAPSNVRCAQSLRRGAGSHRGNGAYGFARG